MKKNKLIELLQQIEGNPEIVIWNGYVDDYMNISTDVEKITLVKETKSFIYESLVGQWCSENKTFDVPEEVSAKLKQQSEQLFKERSWDFPNNYVTEEEFERWYGNKTLTKYVLAPKLRGKTSIGLVSAQDLDY